MDFKRYEFIIDNVDKIKTTIYVYRLFLDDFDKLKSKINDELVDIYFGDSDFDINTAKKDFYSLLNGKDDKKKYGIVSEFFAHLFLRTIGYTQECIFRNLEERSLKKGFDGFYKMSNEFWIVESKSGYTQCIHKDKIKEALDDIEDKIYNTSGNNPWMNAVNHIHNLQNGNEDLNLTKRVKELSKDYINKIKHHSSEFNLIPVSTIYVDHNQTDEAIVKQLNGLQFFQDKILLL